MKLTHFNVHQEKSDFRRLLYKQKHKRNRKTYFWENIFAIILQIKPVTAKVCNFRAKIEDNIESTET